MVLPAERDGELVTDLAAEGFGLREPDVVGIARLGTAHEAWLRSDVPKVILVADPPRLLQNQGALVNRGARLRFKGRGCRGSHNARLWMGCVVVDRGLKGRSHFGLR
jgi:hypothetical protein